MSGGKPDRPDDAPAGRRSAIKKDGRGGNDRYGAAFVADAAGTFVTAGAAVPGAGAAAFVAATAGVTPPDAGVAGDAAAFVAAAAGVVLTAAFAFVTLAVPIGWCRTPAAVGW